MVNKKKDDRSVSWIGSISEELEVRGPVAFSLQRLRQQDHLFAHRSALFYTSTDNIPRSFVGAGPLDIKLPIPTPDYAEFFELKAYSFPRFWVDLIQRQTHKIRWRPIARARAVFTRYDYFAIRWDHLVTGAKALEDALKVGTTGRRDGIFIYYFGAIVDDAPRFMDISWRQQLVQHTKDAGLRIQIHP